MQNRLPEYTDSSWNRAMLSLVHFGMCLAPQTRNHLKGDAMQIASLRIGTTIFVAGFLVLSSAKPGPAQEPPKQQMNVSEPQLRAFAKVYVEVEKIRQTYEPRLKEAKDPEQGKQIQNEAVSKMQEALTKEGLTEDSYGQIFEVARADAGLRKKLIDLINEERQKS